MPRQINLYSPSLREPQRHFAVRSMWQGLAVFTLALLALCGWTLWRSAELQRELASATAATLAEQQRLGRNLAAVPAATDATALNQELAAAQQALAQQRGVLAARHQAALAEGARPAAWLHLLARSTPPAVWLTAERVDFAEGSAQRPHPDIRASITASEKKGAPEARDHSATWRVVAPQRRRRVS